MVCFYYCSRHCTRWNWKRKTDTVLPRSPPGYPSSSFHGWVWSEPWFFLSLSSLIMPGLLWLCINWLFFSWSRTRRTWSQLGREERGVGACASDWPSCLLVSSLEVPTCTSILHFRYHKKIFRLLFATFVYVGGVGLETVWGVSSPRDWIQIVRFGGKYPLPNMQSC